MSGRENLDLGGAHEFRLEPVSFLPLGDVPGSGLVGFGF